MTRKRRRFTAEFKKRVALEALRERDTVQAIASRYEVHPNQVSAWKRQAVESLDEVFSGAGPKRAADREATLRSPLASDGHQVFDIRT
ncbi:MAG: transposase [Gammaproteobacteria bacterium]|nr:transposase [Gammaproteobacteria bacterium]